VGTALVASKWSNDDILREYKNQPCERDFRFIKDPLFFASNVFRKTLEVSRSWHCVW